MKNPLASLRLRFIVAYTLLITVGFGLLLLYAGRSLESASREDFADSLIAQTDLIARLMSGVVEHYVEGESTLSDVETALFTYAEQTGTDLILTTGEGEVIANTIETVSGEHFLREGEIISALDNQSQVVVREDLSGVSRIYTAKVITHDGYGYGILQVSVPATELDEAVFGRQITLGAGMLLMLLMTLVISLLISNSLTRPLAQLQDSARRIGEGDLRARLPISRKDEIGQLAESFNHMAEQVQSMIEEQKAFASNAAHELRTPLTTIRLRTEALISDNLSQDESHQYITEIDSEVHRMTELVNSLNLLSGLDSSNHTENLDQFDLERLARHILASTRKDADARSINLTLSIPNSLPVIESNITHCQIIFRNLLDNAIKYTGDGGTITWQMDVEGNTLISQMKDTGQGIAPDDLPHLTKRFYRADKSRSRQVQGAGLGLSLVKSVLNVHGGTLTISSEGVGMGTQVEVRLPIKVIEAG